MTPLRQRMIDAMVQVLGQPERHLQIPMRRTPQRLPEFLTRAEVAALLDAARSLKACRHRTNIEPPC